MCWNRSLFGNVIAVGNALINVGELYLEDVIEDGKINEVDGGDVIYAVVTGCFDHNKDGGLCIIF